MTAQLSLFARPRPPATEPLPQREPPPPDPWRGFAGLDAEFKRRSGEGWARLEARKRRLEAEAASAVQPAEQPGESEREAPPVNPRTCPPVVQPSAPGQETERAGEPCEECGGRGRWQGELGPVECWRCYGTGLERPAAEDRCVARQASRDPGPPPSAAATSSTCLLCRTPAVRAAGARTTLCPDCRERLDRAGRTQAAREQLAARARADGSRTRCPRCSKPAGACLACTSAVETDPSIGPCAAAGWLVDPPSQQMQETEIGIAVPF